MIPDGALFVWNNAVAVWIAARLGRRLLPDADLATRVLAAWILFVGVTQVCLQALGWTGHLAAVPLACLLGAVGAVGALLSAGGLLGRGHRPTAAPTTAAAPAATSAGTTRRDPLTRWALIGAAVVCLWSLGGVIGPGVTFGWDSFAYHEVAPSWWIQHRSLAVHPFNYQAYYPMNVELHTLWFMLPFSSDAHANLATLSWLGILVSAFAVHARILRQPAWLAALALCCALLSPEIATRLPAFTSTDLGLAAALLGMLALAWDPGDRPHTAGRALLCGLAGGLALGMKPTAAPIVLLVGAFLVRRAMRPSARSGGAWRDVAAFTAGVLALGAPWYVRNLVLTGNPVFPAALGPFEGPLTPGVLAQLSLLASCLSGWRDVDMWSRMISRFLDWPLPLGIAAAVGYAAALRARARLRNDDPPRRAHLTLLMLAGLGFLALFPISPFSGGPNRPTGTDVYQPRFITFWFLTGLVLLPSLARPRPPAVRSGTARPRWLRAVAALALLLGLSGLALATPQREHRVRHNLRNSPAGPLAAAWRALDDLPPGSRVALYSRDPPSHALISPLFGRRLQLHPVAINVDGSARLPLHERWHQHADDWWWEFDARANPVAARRLLRELRGAGVEYLMLTAWPPWADDPGFGPDHPFWAFPEILGEERRVYASRRATLWDVRAEGS